MNPGQLAAITSWLLLAVAAALTAYMVYKYQTGQLIPPILHPRP
jgi:hypothetical protein